MAWTLTIGGVAVQNYVRPFNELKVKYRGYVGIGTLSVKLVEQETTPGSGTYTLNIQNEASVVLVDTGVTTFGGYVRRRKRTDFNVKGIRVWEIECQDYNSDPSDDWVPVDTGPRTVAESDKARITWLFATYGTRNVDASTSFVQTVGLSNLPDMDFQMMTLAEALDTICRFTSAQWYVDQLHRLHYFFNETSTAPWNIDVQSPNNTTTFPCRDFQYPDDTIDYCNMVAVVGGGVYSIRYRGGSPPAAGTRRLVVYHDENLLTTGDCDKQGDAILAAQNNRQDGTLTVWKSGLLPGQFIHIKNTQWSIDSDFRITEVTPRYIDLNQAFYDISFGSNPVALTDLWTKTIGGISRDVNNATNAAISYAEQFLVGRVIVVTSLPALPDADFPQGALVLLTTDEKLYRNTDGSTWTPEVAAVDITGQINTTQISDEAISTPKIAAGAITAGQIAAGAVTADAIAANSIVAGHVTAGAIGAEALAAEIVLADTLLTTGLSGRRVEIDDEGVRAYSASEQIVVNIPTVGTDPVSVVGEIEAASLVSTASAELRGVNEFSGGSVSTLQVGITNPTVAPTVTVSVPSTTLVTSPPYPGFGICYDSSGYTGVPTYLIGADPTVGTLLDMFYEYRVSDGVLLRTVQKTGSDSTATSTIGSTSHVSDTWESSSGSTNSQIGTPLTMPRDGTITKVSAYVSGYGGTATMKNYIWNTSGNVLRATGEYTAGSESPSTGGSNKHDVALTSGLFLSDGTTFWAGFAHTSTGGDGHWWDRDGGSGKTTKKGDGRFGDMTSISTDGSNKPNVYVTYTYTVSSSEEGTVGKIVGIARAGTNIWVLDANGWLFQYNQADGDYLGKFDMTTRVTGTKANAGLFYDGTNLIITTASNTTASAVVRLVKLSTAGAWVSNHDTTGLTINGATQITRGGYIDSGSYWIPLNGTYTGVYPFSTSTYAVSLNYEFGLVGEISGGATFVAGGSGRGWSPLNPTKIWLFSAWWTSNTNFYYCYSWYDYHTELTGTAAASTNLITSAGHNLVAGDRVRFGTLTGGAGLNNSTDYWVISTGLTANDFSVSTTSGGAAVDITTNYTTLTFGTTHETGVSPRANVTIGRRRQVQVSNPAIPGLGGVDDPSRVRVYVYNGASDPGGTGYSRQAEDALTTRTFTLYSVSGSNLASNTFPAGAAAELRSLTGTGFGYQSDWSLKGDGTKTGFLRWVGLSPHIVALSTQITANSGILHVAEMTGLPTDALAVTCVGLTRHTAVTNGQRFNLYDYGGTALRFQIMAGKISGHYEGATCPFVVLGGTNNRQFDYEGVIGAAGTTDMIIYVTGYWTYN